jgi:ABC-2 type transport system ATP-binding protein
MDGMTQTLTTSPRATVPDPVLSVTDLAKSYGDRPVLAGLGFEVAAGEIFGILGPNGSGKTTTVEIAQGLRSADSGRVEVLGLDPGSDRGRMRTLVGSQLQSSALPERLRVCEALRLFARLAGDVVDWRRLMAEWDLDRLERSAFGELSGGEQQRLFLALALANAPRVVFLDELTQGLDPSARRQTWRLVERIRDEGTTVVLVSHYMDEVEYLCDRVGLLRDGRMDVVGTPAELVTARGGVVMTTFSADLPGLAGPLAGLAGVEAVDVAGTSHRVSGDPHTPQRVAAELAGLDLWPDDFRVHRPTLEDVFMDLTTGEAR